jgi:hypothetical protein
MARDPRYSSVGSRAGVCQYSMGGGAVLGMTRFEG